MIELENLIKISKYAGQRFDLVQAGGGNSSVKLDGGKMLVKASGFSLSEVEKTSGYVCVDNYKILKFLDNESKTKSLPTQELLQKSDQCLNSAIEDKNKYRPSIETFLHSLLGKYVLHTHPIAVNVISCKPSWKEEFEKLFNEALCISYKTPGIELGFELLKELNSFKQKHGNLPQIIFLQNHGLVINSKEPNEISELTDSVVEKLEKHIGLDLSPYRITNKISKLIHAECNKYFLIAYRSHIQLPAGDLKSKACFALFPDDVVYCGLPPAHIKNLQDADAIFAYQRQHGHMPKIVIFGDSVFFIARNVRKAKEIEDVFIAHFLVKKTVKKKIINFISQHNKKIISGWAAEQYRQEL
jgi:ribulose-5-phosphate 4-epimerase/fuculose-1-phosphate aldolase